MSPNRFDATTTLNRSGLSTNSAERISMWYLSHLMSGIILRHRLHALVPVRHGDRDAVRLGGRGEMLLRRLAGELEGEFQHAVDADAGQDGLLHDDFAVGAGKGAAADRRIFALGVLAHDPEIDVARLAVGERRRHARHQPHRTQVDVLIELAAEQDQRSPQRDVIRHLRRPADRAEEDRVVLADLLLPVLRHHAFCASRSSRRRRNRTSPGAARSRIFSPPPRARARPPARPPCRCRRRE